MKALLSIAVAALITACATAPVERDVAAPVPHSEWYAAEQYCFSSGTRIRRDDPYCHYGRYGRAYTGDELLRTGAFTVGEALRRLDPALR